MAELTAAQWQARAIAAETALNRLAKSVRFYGSDASACFLCKYDEIAECPGCESDDCFVWCESEQSEMPVE